MTGQDPVPGVLFIISAPSGAGKTTLISALSNKVPGLVYSISHTTRAPRGDEKNGREYFFTSVLDFKKGIEQGQWAEWALVHDNYYGTSARFLDQAMEEGCFIILDIDVQGAAQIKEKYPGAVTVFILPPSGEALKERLIKRGTDTDEVIQKRLINAIKEIGQQDKFEHIIINDRLEDALSQLESIIKSHGPVPGAEKGL